MKLLTFGYTGRSVEELTATLATTPDALLIDVRLSPRSRAAQWSGRALRHRFDARYVHLRQFGNLNYQTGGPIALADAAGGVRKVLAVTRPLLSVTNEPTIVLLCACRDRAHCHRNVVVALLADSLGAHDGGELPRAGRTVLSPQLPLW